MDARWVPSWEVWGGPKGISVTTAARLEGEPLGCRAPAAALGPRASRAPRHTAQEGLPTARGPIWPDPEDAARGPREDAGPCIVKQQ